MLQCIQHEKDKVLTLGVEEVTFDKFIRMDVASETVTLHPDVSIKLYLSNPTHIDTF